MPNPNTARLMVGIEEEEFESIERQVNDIVVIDNRITSSLRTLLDANDPNFPVYSAGQTLFLNLLQETDFLSSTPLEAAYCWSLSCISS